MELIDLFPVSCGPMFLQMASTTWRKCGLSIEDFPFSSLFIGNIFFLEDKRFLLSYDPSTFFVLNCILCFDKHKDAWS